MGTPEAKTIMKVLSGWPYCWMNYVVLVCVVQLCPTLCDAMDCSLQAPLSMSMEFSRQKYWSG